MHEVQVERLTRLAQALGVDIGPEQSDESFQQQLEAVKAPAEVATTGEGELTEERFRELLARVGFRLDDNGFAFQLRGALAGQQVAIRDVKYGEKRRGAKVTSEKVATHEPSTA